MFKKEQKYPANLSFIPWVIEDVAHRGAITFYRDPYKSVKGFGVLSFEKLMRMTPIKKSKMCFKSKLFSQSSYILKGHKIFKNISQLIMSLK